MKKFRTIIFIIVLINIIFFTTQLNLIQGKIINSYEKEKYFLNIYKDCTNNKLEIIDEFSWAFMKYDCDWESKNFGGVKMPKPDSGTILVISDMMSKETCKIALSVYNEDQMETLKALETYDLSNLKIPFYADHAILTMLLANFALITKFIPVFGIQKFSVNEMSLFHNILNSGNLIGDCYSQAILNTAILRLCGFSAEDVFTVLIPMHAINIVRIQNQWYVFDSVSALESGRAIYESYRLPSSMRKILAIENDKYFINFGRGHSTSKPYLDNLFSNIDEINLQILLDGIIPLLNNASLGEENLEVDEFLENAIPCPDISTIQIPYAISDAEGSSTEEKIDFLTSIIQSFVLNQIGDEIPSQYDRSLYAFGLLLVDYPQAYANAAKYGSWTGWYASLYDSKNPATDIQKTIKFIDLILKDEKISNENFVLFSDFSYQTKTGSTIDKAITAYGTLRNMKKDNDFWNPDDLYILITEESNGYLAVNYDNNWKYLNFYDSNLVDNIPPDNINMVFNEIDFLDVWDV